MTTKTLKDIGRELGVSASTVSRVVNAKGNVNHKTQQRVEAYLRDHKYLPNQVARSLKVNTTQTVGIIMPDICEVFFGQIIKGIDAVVSREGYSIILADTGESKQKERHYLELLFKQRVDALVIATVDLGGTKVRDFLDNNIPVVFIDNLPSLTVPFDAVITDNIMASKLAVNHLLEKGHREIAVILGLPEETTGHDRYEGYRLALEEAGIAINPALVAHGDYKEGTGYGCMKALLENRAEAPFTAVYVTAEMMTFGAVKAIRDAGLSIPRDIAIVGFDVHDRTGLMYPGITTVRQHEQEMGRLVGELLLKRLREKQEGVREAMRQRTLLMPFLETRESCGGPQQDV